MVRAHPRAGGARVRRRRRLAGALVLTAALAGCGGSPGPSADERLARGRASLARGDAAAALEDLMAVVADRPEAANDLARAAKVAGRSGEALPRVEEALARNAGDHELLFVAASLQLDVERRGPAERNLRLALAAEPEHWPSILLLARLLTQAHRTREARAHLLEKEEVVCGPGRSAGASQGDRHWATLFLKDLGHILLLCRRGDQALERFGEATRLDPSFAEGHYGLGLARLVTGDLEGAAAALDEALRLDPAHVEAAYQALNVAERRGRDAEASEAKRRFAELYRSRLEAEGALAP